MKNAFLNTYYENSEIYGSENKFVNSSNRFEILINKIKNLNYYPTNILDLGCGTGFLSYHLKKIFPNATVYGIDISKKAIVLASNKYKNIKFLVSDSEQHMPFDDNQFDLILSGEHIEHLSDPDSYLLEINRIIKLNKYLILTTPNLGFWLSRLLLLFGRQPFYLEPSLRRVLPIIKIGNKTFPDRLDVMPAGHLRLYTLDMLVKLLQLYGFKNIKNSGTYFLANFPFKQIDRFFSKFPSLAFGIVIEAEKICDIPYE